MSDFGTGNFGAGAQAEATESAGKWAAFAAMMAAKMQMMQYQQTRQDLMPWLLAGRGALGGLWSYLQQEYNLVPTRRALTEEEYLQGLAPMERAKYDRQIKQGKSFEDIVPADKRMMTSYEWGGGGFGPTQEKYQKSPYYNFLLREGVGAREQGAAARGNLLSGQQQKGLTEYGTNLANMDYQNWLNNWYASLNPLQSMAGVGQTTGNQLGQLGAQAALQGGNFITQYGNALAGATLGRGNIQGSSMNNLGGMFGNALQNIPWGSIFGGGVPAGAGSGSYGGGYGMYDYMGNEGNGYYDMYNYGW